MLIIGQKKEQKKRFNKMDADRDKLNMRDGIVYDDYGNIVEAPIKMPDDYEIKKEVNITGLIGFCPHINAKCKGTECMMFRYRRVNFKSHNKYDLLQECNMPKNESLEDMARNVLYSGSTLHCSEGIDYS